MSAVTTDLATDPVRRPLPQLLDGEIFLIVITGAIAAVLGLLGFAASFTAVSAYASAHGFPKDGFLVPIAIDMAILVFSIANVVLVRLDMGLKWVKWLTWALTAVTIYLNVATGTTAFARVAHATLPALWVVMSTIAEHGYRRWAGLLSGRHMDRIRVSRWLLAPWPTFRLWRRMVLWEITDYRQALTREVSRLAFMMQLRNSYGPKWRRVAPIADRIRARFDLAPDAVPSLTIEQMDLDLDGAKDQAKASLLQVIPDSTPELPEFGTPELRELESVGASLPLAVNGHRKALVSASVRRQAAVTARLGVDRQEATRIYRESVEQGEPLSSRALAARTGVSQSTAARVIAAVLAVD